MKEVKIKAGVSRRPGKDGKEVEVHPAEINVGDKIIKLWQSPKELPIDRFSDFQKYLVQAAGLGSSMGAVAQHFSKLFRLIAGDHREEAAQECQNLMYNINLMLNKVNIDHIAFACLVNEFDNERITDYSEEALNNLCSRMGQAGLTHSMVLHALSEIKKNSIQL